MLEKYFTSENHKSEFLLTLKFTKFSHPSPRSSQVPLGRRQTAQTANRCCSTSQQKSSKLLVSVSPTGRSLSNSWWIFPSFFFISLWRASGVRSGSQGQAVGADMCCCHDNACRGSGVISRIGVLLAPCYALLQSAHGVHSETVFLHLLPNSVTCLLFQVLLLFRL